MLDGQKGATGVPTAPAFVSHKAAAAVRGRWRRARVAITPGRSLCREAAARASRRLSQGLVFGDAPWVPLGWECCSELALVQVEGLITARSDAGTCVWVVSFQSVVSYAVRLVLCEREPSKWGR